MAASSTTEQQEWLQSLCQAVSEGMGVSQKSFLIVYNPEKALSVHDNIVIQAPCINT